MNKGTPVSIAEGLARVTFLPDRTPETTDEEAAPAFHALADYRDGAIYVGHYAGNSEWERHPQGDEIVYVLEGETTLFLLGEDGEHGHALSAGQLLVVPQHQWHRFETPRGVKIMTVTPQPTDHSVTRPEP